VEVHPEPECALCDGPQQIRTEEFAAWVADVKRVVDLMGLVMAGSEPVPAGV
ncbi:MAG: 3-deoxy-7-phosphoheptulonate synthase, partial [Thermoleophilia bacterium]|nr:3-deoxy-7-phosphoheptulonate synthase [Thermoleophilia bacterium]